MNHLLGKQVWITAAPGVPRNVVNATGTVESITGSGRALVLFHQDDEIRRRLNTRGVYIAPAALTTVNPFAKAT
jgi:hypothetical protein